MNYLRICAIITCVGWSCVAPGANYPPADHAGTNLNLVTGDQIWGIHTNVGNLTIGNSQTVTVRTYETAVTGSGFVELYCNNVTLSGTLDASGAGHEGGGGGGGGGGSAKSVTSTAGALGAIGTTLRNGAAGQPGVSGGADNWGLPGGNGGNGGQGGGAFGGSSGSGANGTNGAAGSTGFTGHDGGYLASQSNGDSSIDTSAQIGSGGGGGGGASGGGSFVIGFSGGGGGGGGCGGGAGGGYIKIIATSSMRVAGTIKTSGLAHGQDGTDGSNGTNVSSPSQTATGGAGGKGGNSTPLDNGFVVFGGQSAPHTTLSNTDGGQGGQGGSGAGGGIVVKCDSGNMNLSGATLDARAGSVFGSNGGTVKVFHAGPDPTAGASILGSRTFKSHTAPAEDWKLYY